MRSIRAAFIIGTPSILLLITAIGGAIYANNPEDCVWALDADNTDPCDPSNPTDPPGGCLSDACSNTAPITCRDTTTAWTDNTIYDFDPTGDDIQHSTEPYEEVECYTDVDCSHTDDPDTECEIVGFFGNCSGELLGSTCYSCSAIEEPQTEQSAQLEPCPPS